jgi:hypothetical protein
MGRKPSNPGRRYRLTGSATGQTDLLAAGGRGRGLHLRLAAQQLADLLLQRRQPRAGLAVHRARQAGAGRPLRGFLQAFIILPARSTGASTCNAGEVSFEGIFLMHPPGGAASARTRWPGCWLVRLACASIVLSCWLVRLARTAVRRGVPAPRGRRVACRCATTVGRSAVAGTTGCDVRDEVNLEVKDYPYTMPPILIAAGRTGVG